MRHMHAALCTLITPRSELTLSIPHSHSILSPPHPFIPSRLTALDVSHSPLGHRSAGRPVLAGSPVVVQRRHRFCPALSPCATRSTLAFMGLITSGTHTNKSYFSLTYLVCRPSVGGSETIRICSATVNYIQPGIIKKLSRYKQQALSGRRRGEPGAGRDVGQATDASAVSDGWNR